MPPPSLLHANETGGAFPPSLYAETAPPFPKLPPLTGAQRADVAVIGGGYAGLSTAWHLARRGVDVVVLEAHRVGWGASGRNGGQIGVGQRRDPPELERLVGLDTAREAWEIGRGAARLVKILVRRNGIACDLRDGLIYANHRARFDEATQAHIGHMARVYDYHALDWIPPEEMPRHVAARGLSGGVRIPEGGHLQPLAYARGLARIAREAGARIHEGSEVVEVRPGLVKTALGDLRAETVIWCGNGYAGRLAPGRIRARALPINNFIIATEPLGGLAKTLIPGGEAVADSRFVVNYFRLSPDGRMLFGGGESYGDRFPDDIAATVRPHMLKLFPQLAEAKITHAWGGTLAITPTRLPVMGEPEPGVFVAGGWSGSGVAMATMAGRILAEAVADGARARLEVMAKLDPPAFPGGDRLRRPMLAAAMLLARLRDML